MIEKVNIQKKPIVYFGRLVESKGVETLIEAVFLLHKYKKHNMPPLWIIGGNYEEILKIKDAPKIQDIITYLQDKNLLFWWGQLPHNILPYILCKCSIFCFTSKYEPGGRTILEAMASGLVVIATPFGFAEEVIKDGKNGFILDELTSECLAEKIEYIFLHPRLTKKLGKEAKKTINNNFSLEHFRQKQWDIYENFLT